MFCKFAVSHGRFVNRPYKVAEKCLRYNVFCSGGARSRTAVLGPSAALKVHRTFIHYRLARFAYPPLRCAKRKSRRSRAYHRQRRISSMQSIVYHHAKRGCFLPYNGTINFVRSRGRLCCRKATYRAAGISHTEYISQIRRIYIAGCKAAGFCVAARLHGASGRPRPTRLPYIFTVSVSVSLPLG